MGHQPRPLVSPAHRLMEPLALPSRRSVRLTYLHTVGVERAPVDLGRKNKPEEPRGLVAAVPCCHLLLANVDGQSMATGATCWLGYVPSVGDKQHCGQQGLGRDVLLPLRPVHAGRQLRGSADEEAHSPLQQQGLSLFTSSVRRQPQPLHTPRQ